jgi:outer membrane protein assembly factor BamB
MQNKFLFILCCIPIASCNNKIVSLNTFIFNCPKYPSSSTDITFNFGSENGVSSFECSLDESEWEECKPEKTYFGLKNGPHIFKVRAIDSHGRADDTPAVCKWEIVPYMLWSYVEGGGYRVVVLDDIDNNGDVEVVSVDNSVPEVVVLSGKDGKKIWSSPLTSSSPPTPYSMLTADVDGDGKKEVIGATEWPHEIYALNGEDGSLLWKFNTGKRQLVMSIAVGDINENGDKEVVFTTMKSEESSPENSYVYALNGKNGSEVWAFPITTAASFLLLEDAGGDGKIDVLVFIYEEGVNLLNGKDGSIVWQIKGLKECAFVSVDINNDGIPEAIIGDLFSGVYAIDLISGKILWSSPILMGSRFTSVAAGDIDGDEKLEIVGACSYQNKNFCALNVEDGSLQWAISIDGTAFPPALADVNSDGIIDIVISTGEMFAGYEDQPFIYALNGKDGSILWKYPFEPHNMVESPPVVGDIDGDGKIEVVIGTSSGIYAIKTGAPSLNLNDLVWPKVQHDIKNSGRY